MKLRNGKKVAVMPEKMLERIAEMKAVTPCQCRVCGERALIPCNACQVNLRHVLGDIDQVETAKICEVTMESTGLSHGHCSDEEFRTGRTPTCTMDFADWAYSKKLRIQLGAGRHEDDIRSWFLGLPLYERAQALSYIDAEEVKRVHSM